MPIPADPANFNDASSEEWGYNFIGSSAIDNFLCDLEGPTALEGYSEWERRERANELLFDLVGQEHRLFYLRRKGPGREPGEEKWELTIATDRHDVPLPPRLEKLEKTLGLVAAVGKNGNGGLRLLSARLLARTKGHADGFAVPLRLRLGLHHRHQGGIPPAALKRIAAMPVCGDYVPTEEQLQAWKAFLEVERRIAQARQFCATFASHNYGAATKLITFNIDADSATLDGFGENSLEEGDFWQRAQQARREDIKLCETAPTAKNLRQSLQLGTVEEVDPSSGIIRVRLERDLAEYIAKRGYKLPAKGFLFFEARGEIAQIRRKEQALEDLKRGSTQNPYLGRFFFDVSQARPRQKNIQLQAEELLLSSANPQQKAAVEAVLAAPDLVLIQGPPGTGKTTVIAEICYQVARQGGRTLIASQANLAVDNALSRLVHNPVIRAVRKGKAEKVGEEGLPFLEDQVIGTWLRNTANDCQKNLSQRRDKVTVFRQLLASSARFTEYVRAEEAFEEQQKILQQRKATLESACKAQASDFVKAAEPQRQLKSLKDELEALLNIAPAVDWDDPGVADLLKRLQPHAIGDSTVRSFIDKVKEALALAAELGFKERPPRGGFGLSAWLQETVESGIFGELKRAIALANDTVTAMTEAESAAQTYTQNSNSLLRLLEHRQQLLATLQSLQKKIRKLHNHDSDISLAISELDQWHSTADSQVYNSLKKCLQERRNFTDDLISLPSTLLAAVEASPLPWQQSLAQCQVQVNELIDTYREYDKIHKIASALEQRLPLQPSLDESAVFPATHALGIHGLDSRPALSKLEQLADLALAQGDMPKIEAIRRQANAIKRQFPPHFAPILKQITAEVIPGIVTSARQLLNQLSAETEQEQQLLETELNELQLAADQQSQISATQEQLEGDRREADLKYERAISHLQELARLPQIPNQLQGLVKQYLQSNSDILTQLPQFSAQVDAWKSRISHFETLADSLAPFDTLSLVKDIITVRLSSLKAETESFHQQLEDSQTQLREIDAQLQQQQPSESVLSERTWWQSAWEAIPERLKPTVPAAGLFNPDFLRHVKTQFDGWQQELAQEEAYLNRYQHFVQDWISRIRNPSEQDHNELRQIYLDNANVIGITCVQAAGKDFSQEFKSFDVVIIDEVSKCTPPELLIPALKGKKLVMVGDHRQLPPMLDTSTIEEVAQDIGSTREQLQFLEESLFKSQFETAHESIKQMLTTQYRMHPNIMGAINQFYQDKLQCGILNADTKRAHNLAGPIIPEHHHLIWVKTPLEQGFEEQREGTSLYNIREIDIIERLCQQMEAAWSAKVTQGTPKKEIAVITFYGAQLRKIDERLDEQLFPSLHIRTGTVDRFQGMERPVVIVSMVRNNNQKDVGFAKKPERVNVAFSRAQELLVIVGCHTLFTQARGVGSMYSNVSDVVRLHEGFVDASRILC